MSIDLYDDENNRLDVEYLTFSGGERHVQLGPNVTGSQFVIRAAIRNSRDVIDLLLLADAVNARADQTVHNIEIPYLPYGRQDRVCAPGQAFSLQVFAACSARSRI